MPELLHVSEGPQRSEVFTGGERRRRFTSAEKAAIVEDSYADGTSVCGVARQPAPTQQLFDRRRLARLGPSRSAERPMFVAVIVATGSKPLPGDEPSTGAKPRRRRRRSEEASIELQIDGVAVQVGRDADASALAAGIGALKAAS